LPLNAAILGVGLLTATNVQAQGTVTGKGEQKTITGSTAGPVNPIVDSSPITPHTGSDLIQLRDLLNYQVQSADGAFGRVSDIVFDRNGRVQYLLATHEGRTYPLPFTPSAFTGGEHVLTFPVPATTLQTIAINPQNLPSLQNQVFVNRMQQVFGESFGANFNQRLSAYPPVGPGMGRPGIVGAGTTSGADVDQSDATRPTGGSLNVGGGRSGVGGTGVGGPGSSGSGTGISATRETPGQGISGTGEGTSAAGRLQGAAAGGAPGSTGGTAGSAGGAPERAASAGGTTNAKTSGNAGNDSGLSVGGSGSTSGTGAGGNTGGSGSTGGGSGS